jgi:cytochrome bd-type quinol oxidase subunit 2
MKNKLSIISLICFLVSILFFFIYESVYVHIENTLYLHDVYDEGIDLITFLGIIAYILFILGLISSIIISILALIKKSNYKIIAIIILILSIASSIFIIYTYLNPPIMYDRYVGVDNNYKKQHPEKFNYDNEILENNNNGKIKNEN